MCVPCTLLPKGWQNAGPLPWRPELPTGQAHSPTIPAIPRTAQVSRSSPLPSGTLPDASLLTCPASPDSALCPGYFPLNSSLQARVSPPHPSCGGGGSSPSQTSNVSRPFFLLPFSSSHFRHPHFSPSPYNFTPVSALLTCSPRFPAAPSAHLGEGTGLPTWRLQSSGAAAPSGRGEKLSLSGLTSQCLTGKGPRLLLRLNSDCFQDSRFLPPPTFP